MKRLFFFFLIISIITPYIYGCKNTDQTSKLKEANAKINQLTLQNKKLQEQNNDLIQKHEALVINYEELEEWTKKLVNGYGPGIWYMDESTLPVFIKPVQSGDIHDIVYQLNLKFRQDSLPEIALVKTRGSIAYVRIDDATVLTQQMGTYGATSYIHAVTYSLASVDNIDCVMLDFKEGDHAIPGKYCK